MSWEPRAFGAVLHEVRKYKAMDRELVARINVYRNDEREHVFYELTAEAADNPRDHFIPMELAFVPRPLSRAQAVHFASRKAAEWFAKVEAAVKAANAPQAQNGVSPA